MTSLEVKDNVLPDPHPLGFKIVRPLCSRWSSLPIQGSVLQTFNYCTGV